MRSFALVVLLSAPTLATSAFCQASDPTGAKLDSAMRELETTGL